jgi:hypothetical protein
VCYQQTKKLPSLKTPAKQKGTKVVVSIIELLEENLIQQDANILKFGSIWLTSYKISFLSISS